MDVSKHTITRTHTAHTHTHTSLHILLEINALLVHEEKVATVVRQAII